MADKKEKTIEDNFKEISEIIEKMDNPEVSLEESFKLYNEAVKLVEDCNKRIEKVEKEITVIDRVEE
ncbi:MAG: exodeoxyribonuclease VII small subunit [Lachnospiraceae bacterium]|nr:exodeoxyribonuclease VII small subunit [Lachnospiraceae bacterium]